MAEAAAQLMELSSAVLFYMTVFIRSPGTRNRTPWHPDQPSWSAAGNQACSVWMSVDPVLADTALEFVRGSHRWQNKYRRPPFFKSRYENDDRSLLPEFPGIESDRGQFDIVSWAMEPGDCLVFHGMTAHGGSGDLPPELGRRAVSVQWLGDDARFRNLVGGDGPDISSDLRQYGIRPGDPIVCDL